MTIMKNGKPYEIIYCNKVWPVVECGESSIAFDIKGAKYWADKAHVKDVIGWATYKGVRCPVTSVNSTSSHVELLYNGEIIIVGTHELKWQDEENPVKQYLFKNTICDVVDDGGFFQPLVLKYKGEHHMLVDLAEARPVICYMYFEDGLVPVLEYEHDEPYAKIFHKGCVGSVLRGRLTSKEEYEARAQEMKPVQVVLYKDEYCPIVNLPDKLPYVNRHILIHYKGENIWVDEDEVVFSVKKDSAPSAKKGKGKKPVKHKTDQCKFIVDDSRQPSTLEDGDILYVNKMRFKVKRTGVKLNFEPMVPEFKPGQKVLYRAGTYVFIRNVDSERAIISSASTGHPSVVSPFEIKLQEEA